MTPLSFNTWFKDTELYDYKDGVAKIIVPMGMFKRHLATRYYDLIVNTLSEIVGDNVDIKFFLKEELEEEQISLDRSNNSSYNNYYDTVFAAYLDEGYTQEYEYPGDGVDYTIYVTTAVG